MGPSTPLPPALYILPGPLSIVSEGLNRDANATTTQLQNPTQHPGHRARASVENVRRPLSNLSMKPSAPILPFHFIPPHLARHRYRGFPHKIADEMSTTAGSRWAASASWARYSRCNSSPRCRRSGRTYCRWVIALALAVRAFSMEVNEGGEVEGEEIEG